MEEVTKQRGDAQSQPGPDDAADDDPDHNDERDEFQVVQHDAAVAIAQGFQKPDLLALQRHQPAEREIDEKCRHQKENRRQRAAHIVEHVELVVEPGMRGLILAAVGRLPAIALEQRIEPLR